MFIDENKQENKQVDGIKNENLSNALNKMINELKV